ncbi:MAG: TadE/TadG family type IV pilus assembly protein [Candidatus Thiodiazotropha sp.]|jgi:hypothetical protein
MPKPSIVRCKRRQRGAETVEFMLTLFLFLFVFVMIIDIAITMYDRGAVINASREGARQASLYWVDPQIFDPTTPELNQLLKRSMVDSVMSWTEDTLLIDPQDAGLMTSLRINASEMLGATEHISTSDVVSVDISYPHSFVLLTAFSGVAGPLLRSRTDLGVE